MNPQLFASKTNQRESLHIQNPKLKSVFIADYFLKSFVKTGSWIIAFLTLSILFGNFAVAQIPFEKNERPKSIQMPAFIQIQGPIDYKLSKYFDTRLKQAKDAGVDFLTVEIDSPGGLKSESISIAEKLRDVDWAYTVAFVPKEAISGGALICFGCDEIVIAPTANFGDIGEIYLDPEENAFRFVPAKYKSYLVTAAKSLAISKGRPPELVEALIDKDIMVYMRDVPNGPPVYKTVRVDADEKPAAPWSLIEESGPERFLTVSGARAKEIGIAETIGSSQLDLAKEFHFNPNQVKHYKPSSTDTVVYYLNSTFVTGLLVVIGLIALYVEFSAPGIGIGGLISGLCAALFFWSRFLGGTSTWLEVILFAAGLTFIAIELFVIPGFGVAGLTGLILLVASIVMASQDFIFPSTGRQWNQLTTSLLMILCSSAVFLLAALFLARKLGSMPMFSQMILAPKEDTKTDDKPTDEETGKPIAPSHPLVSVGDWGRAESLLRPAGRAVFNGRSVDVVSDGSFVDPGVQVRVIKIQGNMIMVAAIEEHDDAMAETTYPTNDC